MDDERGEMWAPLEGGEEAVAVGLQGGISLVLNEPRSQEAREMPSRRG